MPMREFKLAEHAREIEDAVQRAHDARVKELSIHPIVKAGCDRNVREAYFCGLAYAAICNDDRIDDAERDILLTIGNALALDPAFVSDVIKWSVEDDDAKRQAMLLFTEVLCTLHNLPSVWMPYLFAAEFARIRLVGPEPNFDLAVDFKDIGDGLGMPLVNEMDRIVSVIKDGVKTSMNCVDSLAELLGDDVAKYFVLRDMDLVDEPLAKFRADRAVAEAKRKEQSENKRTLPERLATIVESDDAWPVEFNPADYKALFDDAGIVNEDVGAFVAMELLPYMKRACEAAREQINKVPTVHDEDSWKSDNGRYHGAKFEANREFRVLFRYAFFIDAFVDLNDVDEFFYFVGPENGDCNYYLISLNFPESHITYKRIGRDRFEQLRHRLAPGLSGLIGAFPDQLFDRLRFSWNIYNEDSKRYFAQWEGLFAAIEARFAAKVA